MRVVRGKTFITSDLTVDEDLDFLTLYQAKRLASPASGEALRKGSAEILNAEIHAAAAIAYSKLNLTGAVKAADIEAAAAIPLSKLVNTVASMSDLTNALINHANVSDAHQDAPTLISDHAGAVDPHGDRAYTDGLVPTIASKASDEAVNNSETLQNDDDLVLAVGANDIWLFTAFFRTHGPSGNANIKYLFTLPSGGSLEAYGFPWTTGAPHTPADGTTQVTLNLAADTIEWTYKKYLYIGGGTAGNVQLQWAQLAATVEDTKMKTGSYLLAHRLA